MGGQSKQARKEEFFLAIEASLLGQLLQFSSKQPTNPLDYSSLLQKQHRNCSEVTVSVALATCTKTQGRKKGKLVQYSMQKHVKVNSLLLFFEINLFNIVI